MDTLSPAFLEGLLERALSGGGQFAELFAESRTSTTLLWDDQHLDRGSTGTECGAGLRVLENGRTWFANSNDLSREGLCDLAGRVAQAIGKEPSTKVTPLVAEQCGPGGPEVLWPDEVPIADMIFPLQFADSSCRAYDPRVTQVTAHLATHHRKMLIANSEGRMVTEETPYTTLACSVVARYGSQIRSGYQAASHTRGWEMINVAQVLRVARKATRIACLQLEATSAPSGTMPVVLSGKAGGTMIHEACGHGLEADFYIKNLSIYSGKLGSMVASPKVSVLDDGTIVGRRGTNRVDDEGAPVSRVLLIDHGRLVGLLHSRQTAAELKMPPTGNGRRESYRHLPIPRMRNTFIQPGDEDPEEIFQSVEDGVLVVSMGGGEVDIVSGNFVFHCTEAYRIRRGKLGEALRDATLTGNGPAVLMSIERVGNDLGWDVGTCGKDGQAVPVSDAQPTILIPALVVGGAGS